MKAEADKMLRKKEQAAEEKIAAEGGLGAVMKRKSMKPERFYGEAAEEPEGEEEEEPERRMVKKQKVSPQVDGLKSTITLITAEKEGLKKDVARLEKEVARLKKDLLTLRSQVESQGDESLEGLE